MSGTTPDTFDEWWNSDEGNSAGLRTPRWLAQAAYDAGHKAGCASRDEEARALREKVWVLTEALQRAK